MIQKISSGQTFTHTLNLCCDLDLEQSYSNFNRTLQFLMLYYQTKFGCKRTSSLEDTTEIVIFDHISPHCDLDIEHSEPIFLHGTLAYDAA